jgi:anti-sigma regulatory factor (Ser/Thr protein kinase)
MAEIVVEAVLQNLPSVLDFVEKHTDAWPQKMKNHISIAVDEIFTNIASYAYAPETGSATIRITDGEIFTLEFEDSGIPFNPLERDDPDIKLGLDERKIGGLGIFMTKKLMDCVEYRREDGKNILTIKKTVI